MQLRVFLSILIVFMVFDILKLRIYVSYRKGPTMTQKQLEHIEAPDTTQAQLERTKWYIIQQVERSTDFTLMDLIARLLFDES